ncbi:MULTISPECIES: NADH:ubiquinone oxidoreductase [Vibrio]|uniref:NADH:ubiquinone oxidoreductase n=1 Tax=Vibrio TaxID=662 RepID=UPI000C16F93F|nr:MULTISPECIES: NADH:ubiquinone oxidoreductase [Vibrio]NAW69470.1 NADH:ubiquinone oxidoreductase [Vibrio sp. V28_P6S34P95]NAX06420.1 NADH:ubiquinone oxidoreductase [Vibrio sp. V30_P3S12P165]NAX33192.1 NADH:ubiquinone oxidoreductase [Vibrio sp. V29_P1S30P107]NAX36217.1 NADH:ubiquinone oxidoreductase [Vibrio sp. V27_P1S3P104]NAX39098.1 NADH:ubiquinone oxidoreductase [Vibrio sp. V26_P1S5P106]
MRWLIIAIVSVSAAIASADHVHSFFLGFSIAVVAVSSCYWLTFRCTRFPELALMLLFLGVMVKMLITIVGVLWAVSLHLMSSPAIFGLSYLFFSIVTTYLWFQTRSNQLGLTH